MELHVGTQMLQCAQVKARGMHTWLLRVIYGAADQRRQCSICCVIPFVLVQGPLRLERTVYSPLAFKVHNVYV